jgi:sialate O-acetylesterase
MKVNFRKIIHLTGLFILTLNILSCDKEQPLSLPSIFSNHMVLQQNTEVEFWGKAKPFDNIIIKSSWGSYSETKADKSGNWEIQIDTPSAGGPFQVDVKSSTDSKTFIDVMIGEVWLASGQSNMAWKLNQCEGCIDDQKTEIQNANYNLIRFFNHPTDLSKTMIDSQKWKIVNPENAAERDGEYAVESFSAVGYFFARELHKKLNVPIGIIGSYWGGTRVEAWTSRKKLNEILAYKLPVTNQKIISAQNKEDLSEFYQKYNDSVARLNKEVFGFDSFELPQGTNEKIQEESWGEIILNDEYYSDPNFDDSNWNQWIKIYDITPGSETSNRFENILNPKDFLLHNGVLWLRTEIHIKDLSSNYTLIYEKGADDTDQTFFNGKLIGNTFGWNKERSYLIDKSNLKLGKNTLAIRLSDLDGPGGFNGRILMRNETSEFEVPIESFKYKHHAFFLDGKLIVHHLTKKELTEKSNYIKENITRGFSTGSPVEYATLYDNILTNLIPYTIKGTIWYQGEANTVNSNEYQLFFSAMIEDWRNSWGYDFPFYYAQLAPFPAEGTLGVREAQRKTLLETKNTGMAVLMDIGEENDIHPHNKQDVGKRLALMALKNQYDYDLVASGPTYKNHFTEGKFLYVKFEQTGTGLVLQDGENIFEIAGEDNNFFPATVKIEGNLIRLYSKHVEHPKNMRYGWKNWTVGTLFNKEGLPASSFTTLVE